MDKNTKILIPEIPGEWTQRTRSGHTNIWNDAWHNQRNPNPLPEVRREPPEKGLYAERIDGAWYWVCGCEQCLGNGVTHSYIICDAHDHCDTCKQHRSVFKEAVWGLRQGWRCRACQETRDIARKAEALAAAAEKGHNEDDCQYTDNIICPYCATEQGCDDITRDQKRMECRTCGGHFDLVLHFEVTYTTTKSKEGIPD